MTENDVKTRNRRTEIENRVDVGVNENIEDEHFSLGYASVLYRTPIVCYAVYKTSEKTYNKHGVECFDSFETVPVYENRGSTITTSYSDSKGEKVFVSITPVSVPTFGVFCALPIEGTTLEDFIEGEYEIDSHTFVGFEYAGMENTHLKEAYKKLLAARLH